MTKDEEIARINDLIRRIRRLIPQVRDDGWPTITRLTEELLDRIEGDYKPANQKVIDEQEDSSYSPVIDNESKETD